MIGSPVLPPQRLSSRTIRRSTKSATRSKTCSAGSKTGAEFTPDTIAALTPSFQPYALQQPSSSGFDLMSSEPSDADGLISLMYHMRSPGSFTKSILKLNTAFWRGPVFHEADFLVKEQRRSLLLTSRSCDLAPARSSLRRPRGAIRRARVRKHERKRFVRHSWA
jgi:hypothetical protein